MSLTIVQGVLAGFVGALVMGIAMMAMSKGKPGVNAMLVARATGKKPDDAKMGGMVAHFVYGILMGVLFVLESGIVRVDALLGLDGYWINGILFGLLLFLIAGIIVMPAAGITKEMREQMPKSQMAGMLVLHLAYGLILAAGIGWVPVTGPF